MDAPPLEPVWLAQAKLAIAALCGGMLRLFFRPVVEGSFTRAVLKSVWLLFGCVTCGYYGTPVVMTWWGFDPSYSGAVGALIGFVGLSVAEGILKGVDGFQFANLLRFFVKSGDAK